MLQLIKNLVDYFLNLLISLIQLLKSPFQPQPCKRCSSCQDYTDEELFTWMKERSTLLTYSADMLAERIIDRPLKCSRCSCPREKHGNLKQKILTCDMMPNGGVVYIEKLERERLQRRRNRFGVAEETQIKVETMDLKQGTGRTVRQGDQVQCHYDAFITSTMEKFESSRDGDALHFTVGTGTVVTGLEQGIIGSTVGSKRRIFVPSPLAYGPKQIRGERFVDITFEIDVLAVLSN